MFREFLCQGFKNVIAGYLTLYTLNFMVINLPYPAVVGGGQKGVSGRGTLQSKISSIDHS